MRQSHDKVRPIRHKKRSAAPIFGLWLFLLFSCLLAFYCFINSSFFAIRHYQIEGNTRMTKEQVVEQAGLITGTNIFRANIQQATERMTLLPSMKNVAIRRKVPGTILIKITERDPVALVVSQGGFIVVDDEGVCLETIAELQDLQLPVISGVSTVEAYRPGSRMDTPGLNAALQLIARMDKALLENVAEIIAPSPLSLTLKTLQGLEIRFGEPVELERKVKTMEDLLVGYNAIINSGTVEYIDLRYDTAPVIKRKQ